MGETKEEILRGAERRVGRRAFLRDAAISLLAGGVIGGGSRVGLQKGGTVLADWITARERQLEKMKIDLEDLVGVLDRKIDRELEAIKAHNEGGKLQILYELGYATDLDVENFEKLMQQARKFQSHYSFVERARQYKDKIVADVLSLDEKAESMMPETIQGLNDFIREQFGQPKDKEGKDYRKAIRNRIGALVRIYEQEHDTRKAQHAVLRRIKSNLENVTDMTPAEREMYVMLETEMQKKGQEGKVKDFILNYSGREEYNELQLALLAYFKKSEEIYTQIQTDAKHLEQVHGLLKDEIEVREQVRAQSALEFKKHEDSIDNRIDELKTVLDEKIEELRSSGLQFQTYQDEINDGTIGSWLYPLVEQVAFYGSIIFGAALGGLNLLQRRKNAAYRNSVGTNHDLAGQVYDGKQREKQLARRAEIAEGRNAALQASALSHALEVEDLRKRSSTQH